MSTATFFYLYFTFPVSADPLLAAGYHGYWQTASFLCLSQTTLAHNVPHKSYEVLSRGRALELVMLWIRESHFFHWNSIRPIIGITETRSDFKEVACICQCIKILVTLYALVFYDHGQMQKQCKTWSTGTWKWRDTINVVARYERSFKRTRRNFVSKWLMQRSDVNMYCLFRFRFRLRLFV